MNRRTKWAVGVTVALLTAATLRITVGHRHDWRHRYHEDHSRKHASCEGRWSDQEKKQTPRPTP